MATPAFFFALPTAASPQEQAQDGDEHRARLKELTLLCEEDLRIGRYALARDRVEVLARLADEMRDRFDRRAAAYLASFLFKLGRHEEALDWLDRVIPSARAADDHCNLGKALNIQAVVLEELGLDEAALDSYGDAIERLGPCTDPYTVAVARINRGRIALRSGDLAVAAEDFYAALEQAERDPSCAELKRHAESGFALMALADGRSEDARQLMLRIVSEQRSRAAEEYLLFSLATLARVHLQSGQPAQAGACVDEAEALLGKMEPLGPRSSALARSRYAIWADLAQDVAARELAAPNIGEEERAGIRRAGLRAAEHWRGRALLSSLKAKGGRAGLELDSLGRALGKRRALVEYATGLEQLRAYVLTSSGLELVELGERRALERSAREYVETLFALREPRVVALARQGSALYRALFAPIAERLPPEVDEIVLVPSEGLADVPFDALVIERCERSAEHPDGIVYVLDRWTVTRAPSASAFALLQERGPRESDGRFLLVADAVFPAEAARRTPPRRGEALSRLERLVGSRQEAIEIALGLVGDAPEAHETRTHLAQLAFAGPRDAELLHPEFDLLLGESANVAAFGRSLEDYASLHFATHGHVTAFDASTTGLVLSADAEGRCMLDLAAIRALELDANTVVLSACDSAVGRVLKGEGTQSIAASFLEAGARGVVATLWVVGDAATQDIMGDYYAALRAGAAATQALRSAKLKRRRSTDTRGERLQRKGEPQYIQAAHPHLWAPFVYIGRSP